MGGMQHLHVNNPFLRLDAPIGWGDPARISSRGPAEDLVGLWDGTRYFRVSIWGRDMEYIISRV